MALDHRKALLILEWNWPGRFVNTDNAWNGVENYQDYLDREIEWNGVPVTALEIAAEEANYDANRATLPDRIIDADANDGIGKAEVKAAVLYAAKRAGDDIAIAAVRQAAYDEWKDIYKLVR